MKFTMDYPKKVIVGDISIRDGLQHEEKFISNWKGSVFLVETIEQAIALAKLLDEGMIWGTKV